MRTRGGRPSLVLLAATVARSAIFLEITVVGVALPALVGDLDTTASRAAWAVTAYTLAIAAAVVPLGRLGDRIGHRRLLLWALSALIIASLACALSPNMTVLLVSRVAQGLAAAALLPSTQAVVAHAFDGAARTRALGRMVGFQALVFASGPIIGGLLIAGPGWRWAFLVVAPFALAGLGLVWAEVPHVERRTDRTALAIVPSALLAASASAITLAGVEARNSGSWFAVSSAVVGIALGIAFVLTDGRSRSPLLDRRLVGERRYLAGITAGFLYQFAMLASSVVLLAYFQLGLGMSAQRAGLAFIPVSLPLLGAGSVVAPLVNRVGVRIPLAAGLVCLGVGFVLSGLLATGNSYWGIAPALLIIGIGISLTVTPIQVLAVGEMHEEVRGLAGGGLSLVRQIGGAMGVAALTTVLGAVERNEVSSTLGSLSSVAAGDLESLVAGRPTATAALRALPASVRRDVVEDGVRIQSIGTRAAMLTGGALMLVGALGVLSLVARTRPPSGAPTPDTAGGE